MAELVLIYHDTEVRSYPLAEKHITIGRRSDNTIQLDDPAVSGRHALLVVTPPEYGLGEAKVELFDDNSTNGTFINDTKIKRQVLRHGDLITIGRHQLRYRAGDSDRLGDTTIILSDTRSG